MKDFTFGNLITSLRCEKGYSQYQLGRLVGVSDKAVSKWENGSAKPRMSTCCKLADVLGVSLDVLLASGNPSQQHPDQVASWVPRAMRKEKQMNTREDNAPVKRIELHARTGFSATDGIGSPADLITRIAQWGQDVVAITDFNSVQSLPMAFRIAKRKGVKVIAGCEMLMYDADGTSKRVMLLAAKRAGIISLNKLITMANLQDTFDRSGITREWLTQNRAGLLVGASCEQGELQNAVAAGCSEDQLCGIAAFYDYIEIQPPENDGADMKQAKARIRLINRIGQKAGKPVVAVSNSCYLDREDSLCRSILRYNLGRIDYEDPGTHYLRTTEEMLEAFAFLGCRNAEQVVVTASREIAGRIRDDITLYPAGDSSKTFLPSLPDARKKVMDAANRQAALLYGAPLPVPVRERLELEQQLIDKQDSWVHFAIAQQLTDASRKAGHHVGSRGSVGASLIAHLAGITEVNPLPPHYRCPGCTHTEFTDIPAVRNGANLPARGCPVCGKVMFGIGCDIPIETFLGWEGDRMPDIDLNFSLEFLPQIEPLLKEMFGEEHVLRAGIAFNISFDMGRHFVKQYMSDHHLPLAEPEAKRIAEKMTDALNKTGAYSYGYVIIPAEYGAAEFTAV